jgi:hypothetical protein
MINHLIHLIEAGELLGSNSPLWALTPMERWSALRRLGSDRPDTGHWITLIVVCGLVVALALLIKMSFNHAQDERRRAEVRFIEQIRRRNLSVREFNILIDIFKRSGLRRRDAILKDAKAFERGTERLNKELLTKQSLKIQQRFQRELAYLREKLGFTKLVVQEQKSVKHRSSRHRDITTRELPLEKIMSLTPLSDPDAEIVKATVVDNDDEHVIVSLEVPVDTTNGDMWRANCHFGASIWDFHTSVVRYRNDHLKLTHSDDVHFITQKGFPEVPAPNVVFVAQSPFTSTTVEHLNSHSMSNWQPVHFTPATVTRFSKSELVVETSLEGQVGERIMVVFKLDIGQGEGDTPSPVLATHVLEDMGIVLQTHSNEKGFTIEMELIGLTHDEVDKIMRVSHLRALGLVRDSPPKPKPEPEPEPEPMATVTVSE